MNIRKTHTAPRSQAATRLFLNRSIFAALVLGPLSIGSATCADEPSLPAADPTTEAASVISSLPKAPAPGEDLLPAATAGPEFTPALSAANTSGPAKAVSPAVAVKQAVTPPASATENIWQIARRRNLALPLSQGRIIVWKSQRKLELWNGDTLVKSFPVALGAQPVGHKQQQGDGRTPEGEFFICTRNATSSAFHVFLGLSYPALPDAKRAVNSKAITWQEYRAIQQRLASRSAPLWRTRLGGWVGIHGGSDGQFAARKAKERGRKDWTAGCIALTDRQIEEIYAATRLGTPVSVRP